MRAVRVTPQRSSESRNRVDAPARPRRRRRALVRRCRLRHLNQTKDFDGVDRQPHSVYKTDYTVTIPITGQAQLDFYTIDGDHHQVTNNGTMTVPNVKTAQPYNGNFLELTVVAVTRAN